MNNEKEICATEGCHNKRISLSDHCGEHVANTAYLAKVIGHLKSNNQHQHCTVSNVELEPEKAQVFKD